MALSPTDQYYQFEPDLNFYPTGLTPKTETMENYQQFQQGRQDLGQIFLNQQTESPSFGLQGTDQSALYASATQGSGYIHQVISQPIPQEDLANNFPHFENNFESQPILGQSEFINQHIPLDTLNMSIYDYDPTSSIGEDFSLTPESIALSVAPGAQEGFYQPPAVEPRPSCTMIESFLDELKNINSIPEMNYCDQSQRYEPYAYDYKDEARNQLRSHVIKRTQSRKSTSNGANSSNPNVKQELTPEEALKKQQRKDKNKIAATKCRIKKQKEVEKTQEVAIILEQQTKALEKQRQQLLNEKRYLECLLQTHQCTQTMYPSFQS